MKEEPWMKREVVGCTWRVFVWMCWNELRKTSMLCVCCSSGCTQTWGRSFRVCWMNSGKVLLPWCPVALVASSSECLLAWLVLGFNVSATPLAALHPERLGGGSRAAAGGWSVLVIHLMKEHNPMWNHVENIALKTFMQWFRTTQNQFKPQLEFKSTWTI